MDKIELLKVFNEVLDELRQSDEVIHELTGSGNNDYIYKRIEDYKKKFIETLNK